MTRSTCGPGSTCTVSRRASRPIAAIPARSGFPAVSGRTSAQAESNVTHTCTESCVASASAETGKGRQELGPAGRAGAERAEIGRRWQRLARTGKSRQGPARRSPRHRRATRAAVCQRGSASGGPPPSAGAVSPPRRCSRGPLNPTGTHAGNPEQRGLDESPSQGGCPMYLVSTASVTPVLPDRSSFPRGVLPPREAGSITPPGHSASAPSPTLVPAARPARAGRSDVDHASLVSIGYIWN